MSGALVLLAISEVNGLQALIVSVMNLSLPT